MSTIGRDKAEQIIGNYRKGYAARRQAGEELVTNLEEYLVNGGYGKAPRKELEKFAVALGLVEIARGRFGGVIPPLTEEERDAIAVAREVAKEEPLSVPNIPGAPDPLAGLTQDERNMIIRMAESLRASKG